MFACRKREGEKVRAIEAKGFTDIIKSAIKGKNAAAFAALALGIVLLLVSGGVKSETSEKTTESEFDELSEYADKLEKNLADIISDIDGTGDANVMITFDSSFESIYAYNAGVKGNANTDSRTSEKELVLTEGNGREKNPVLVKKLCPKVKGVLVVCKGGNDERVREKITDAATALFGITSNRVEVIGGDDSIEKRD